MTVDPNDPTPPPPLPTPEEVQEISKRDRVRAIEAEVRASLDTVTPPVKARVVGFDFGRVIFRQDGVDTRFTVFICYECGGLFLKDQGDQHARYHDRINHA